MKRLIFTGLILFGTQIFADETCSRVAYINYQPVLVDTSSNNKGEGLRYYLEKDDKAKELLDQYQAANKPTLIGAGVSTLGTTMLLAGALTKSNNSEQSQFLSKNFLIYGGASLIIMSYMTYKTLEYTNEKILNQSIEHYNKRNSPQIFFSPVADGEDGMGIGFGYSQEF